MYVRANMPGMPLARGLRGLRSLRRLGCGNCGPKRLGQDSSIYDTQYGGGGAAAYETQAAGNLPLAPTQAAFNANPYSYSGIAPGGAAGDSAALFKAATGYAPPVVSPASFAAAPIFSSAGSPAAAAPAGASSLTAYLPYAVLGLGAIAVISVLKRR